MQKLLLAEDVFDELENGKNVTIRKGRRDIALGDLLFESTDIKRKKIVNVINVHYCKFGNIYIGDLRNDGFKDWDDMFEKMKRFYSDLSWSDECTTIKFTTFV